MAPQSLFCASLLAASALAFAPELDRRQEVDVCAPVTQYVSTVTNLYPVSTYVPTNTVLSIDINLSITIDNAPTTVTTTVTSTQVVTSNASPTGIDAGNGNGNGNGNNGNGNGNNNGNGSGNGGSATANGGNAAGGAGGAGGAAGLPGNNGVTPATFLLTVQGLPLQKRALGPIYVGVGAGITSDCGSASVFQLSNSSLFGSDGQIAYDTSNTISTFSPHAGGVTTSFSFSGSELIFSNGVFVGGVASFCFLENKVYVDSGTDVIGGCVTVTLGFTSSTCGSSGSGSVSSSAPFTSANATSSLPTGTGSITGSGNGTVASSTTSTSALAPTASSFLLTIQGLGGKHKRAGPTYLMPDGSTTSTCQAASVYRIDESFSLFGSAGEISCNAKGLSPFAPGDGQITSSWSFTGTTLILSNSQFATGFATFCFQSTGVFINGDASISSCTSVSLSSVSSDCGSASSSVTPVSSPSITSSASSSSPSGTILPTSAINNTNGTVARLRRNYPVVLA